MQHSWYNSTLFYQQVKEVGQSRTFDCARGRTSKYSGGVAKFAAPLLALFRSLLATNPRGTRVLNIFLFLVYSILILK